MLTPGTFLQNRYRILRQIGGGGMGTVYLAEDTRLPGRRCAVKEMSPANVPQRDLVWAIPAFQQEAQMLAGLSHPGLTAVTDFFSEGNNWYLVMEYVEGETLENRLQRSPGCRLPLQETLDIMRQLCDVLEYLHNQMPPVIFRDLKPGNVMLTPRGEVKLIDFGIARFFKPEQTRDTVRLGTPGYAAPEQYSGQGQSDSRSDIYSLGVLLHEMLTGHDPTTTPFNLPPVIALNPGLPKQVEQVVQQATHVQPHRRFQNIPQLRQALFPSSVIPLPPISPGTQAPPSVVAPPLGRKWLFRIPVNCTLEDAKKKVFWAERARIVQRLVREISEREVYEAHVVALIGYAGVGTSAIVKSAINAKAQRLVGGQSELVARLDLSRAIQMDEPVHLLQEILIAMQRGRGSLDRRMRRAVEDAYKEHVLRDRKSGISKLKLTFPLEIAPIPTPIGSVSFGGSSRPLEFERVSDPKAAQSPETDHVSQEQVAQQRCEQLLMGLRHLVDYLVENKVRVTLVFDRLGDSQPIELLRPFMSAQGVSTILIVQPSGYDERFQDMVKKTIYVPCLWDMAHEVCNELVGGKSGVDTKEYHLFLKNLEFRGRGLPRRIMDELEKVYVATQSNGPKRWFGLQRPFIEITEEYVAEAATFAEVQMLIERSGWSSLLSEGDHLPIMDAGHEWSADHAKLGLYATMDWVIEQAMRRRLFGKQSLCDVISQNLSLDKNRSKVVTDNLVSLLTTDGKIRATSRGFDAIGCIVPPLNIV